MKILTFLVLLVSLFASASGSQSLVHGSNAAHQNFFKDLTLTGILADPK
jgi:hypothetical protein